MYINVCDFLKVTEDMSVHDLKVLVATELDIPVERQRLMFKGRPMHGMTDLLYF